MPIRKPRTSLPRRPEKPPDEPKKTPDTNKMPVEKFNSKEENPTEKGFRNRSKKPKPDDTQPETEEEWEPVTDRHQLRNTKERTDIAIVMPKLNAIMTKRMKSTTEKPPQWIITKYQLIQTLLEQGKDDTTKLKAKTIMQHIRRIASELNCTSDLFITKKQVPKTQKKWISNSLPPESLHAEFEQNIEEYNFDSEHEIDTTDMPDLYIPPEPYNSTSEDDSDTTDGARYTINLDNTTGMIKANLTKIESTAIAARKIDDRTSIQDKREPDDTQEPTEKLDDTTQRIDDQLKVTELLLDKEMQEIESIPIHNPKTQYHDTSYEDYDIEGEVANVIDKQRQAIDMQIQEQTKAMEANWKAIARQQETRLIEQADFQASIAAQEHNRAREEFLQLGTDIETARQTLDIILAQTDMIQESTNERHRDLTNLVKEAKQVGTSIQRDTATIQDLITITKAETTKLRQAIRDSTTAPQDLEDTTRTAVTKTVQLIIDSQMSKIERGIQGTLLNKGKIIAAQAKQEMTALVSETKTIMTDDLEYHWRKLSNMLNKQANDTHNEASSLLDQTVMLLGEEMQLAHNEFYTSISEQNEKNRQIDSIQKRVLNAIRPQIDELQAKLVREVNTEITVAFQNAQDDLHLQQGMLTKTADEKLRAHNLSMDANAAGLQADLRREAELIDHELRDQQRNTRNDIPPDRQEPSTPETTNVPTHPTRQTNNPYNRPNQVSPLHSVAIPSEDAWNLMVSKCKEKVNLSYTIRPGATEFTETQAEAFYRQTESNFKGYHAVRLRRFEDLTRRGSSIPVEYAMGWPPQFVSEGSTILYEKLHESIPHTMVNALSVLEQFQTSRDGYQALMTLMKRNIPRLGQLPPMMEPTWPKDISPTEYANRIQRFIVQQENQGRMYTDFEIMATMAQRAMEHQEYYNAGSNKAAQLVQMAAQYEDFKDVQYIDGDHPHLFATSLETWHQSTRQPQINTTSEPSIRKFERGNRNNSRPPRDGDRDPNKPKMLCPCCLRHGHDVEKGSVCWMGAQVENVLKYNKEHPEQSKRNMENFKTAINPVTIKKMQIRFPEEFEGIEPDSMEMLDAAVELFEMFQGTE